MMFFMILSLWALMLCPSREAWAQKSLPTVRIGIEAVAGTNSHYYVTKQLGLFQKQGLNLELISFPGGTVGIQSLLAGELQFATADGKLPISRSWHKRISSSAIPIATMAGLFQLNLPNP